MDLSAGLEAGPRAVFDYVDGGPRGRGGWIGRAHLYGLMAGGERGFNRVADLLERDLRRTMQLPGAAASGS